LIIAPQNWHRQLSRCRMSRRFAIHYRGQHGRNDDMVDMMTQAAAWLLQTPTRHITVWPTAWSGPVRRFYE